MLTDTHCHIFKGDYDDIEQLIQNAKNNNVSRFINNATDKQTILETIELANIYDSMYAAIGFHPEFADSITTDDLKFLESHLNNNKVIAIGEIGLDYHYTKENKDKQIKLFEYQLAIAQKYNIPVIIHNREATQDIIDSLKKFKVRGVIHCFNGSLETANIFIKMGFLLGVNGVVTFKNCKTKKVLESLSLDNIVLETDCPYLTPEPNRGKKNEPMYIKDIAEFVASIYNTDISQVEKITNRNIDKIFDI